VKVLVTGVAGFIGMHCAERLCGRGDEVVGIDNLSPYYSVELKEARLARLRKLSGFRFQRLDLVDAEAALAFFKREEPDVVLHLAAQAGVRHSIEHPDAYVQANLVGFANVLESCRRIKPRHLVYASSSSVYGANRKLPWSESDPVDHPVSFYAATKKANELMAHSYSHLFNLPSTAIRYFTVFGPWGRPDMSPMLFASAIMEGKPIQVFNHGDMQRDFTFVDDAVEASLRLLDLDRGGQPAAEIYNVGNHQPVSLLDYIKLLEKSLGKTARIELKPMQPGDVKATYADTARLAAATGFSPSTPLAQGLDRFAHWFKAYHGYANR
jgi:UDP-glucuronate 4-epimerase